MQCQCKHCDSSQSGSAWFKESFRYKLHTTSLHQVHHTNGFKMSRRSNAKSLKKGHQFVWNATLNSKWGKIWKSRKLGLIGCQQEGGRPRCSLWHFDNCRSTSLGSISTFFVHLFQFIFLYKKGKTPQLQDGASETVLSQYVKRPIQRNYDTSHLSIPPKHQAPNSTIQGVTKNLIKQ